VSKDSEEGARWALAVSAVMQTSRQHVEKFQLPILDGKARFQCRVWDGHRMVKFIQLHFESSTVSNSVRQPIEVEEPETPQELISYSRHAGKRKEVTAVCD
jgi:hypothetical protein